jgi:hypothetical protein
MSTRWDAADVGLDVLWALAGAASMRPAVAATTGGALVDLVGDGLSALISSIFD